MYSHLPGMELQPCSKFMQIKKSKPEQGMLEINNDAVIGISHSLLAAVVRNVGECLQAVVKSYSAEPEVAEAEAFKWFFFFFIARELKQRKITFEGDLKSVFKLSDSKTFQASWRTSYVPLDIVDLSQVFDFCCFESGSPTANKSMHVQGTRALQNSLVGQLWDYSIIPLLLEVVASYSSCSFPLLQ